MTICNLWNKTEKSTIRDKIIFQIFDKSWDKMTEKLTEEEWVEYWDKIKSPVEDRISYPIRTITWLILNKDLY